MRFLIFALWILPISAQNLIEQEIEGWLTNSKNISASISFEVHEINEGKVDIVAELNGKTALIPASTTKLFSTALALETLGPDFRPETRFYVDQLPDENRVLHGDLYVRCLGDPSLGSRFFHNGEWSKAFLKTWCDSIRKMGIVEIKGSIIIDGSVFGYNGVPNGWNWSDIGNYYGSGPSAAVVADNTTYLHFRTGPLNSTAQLMYSVPSEPKMMFNSQIEAKAISGDLSLIYGAPFSYDRFGTGALPANRNDFVVKASMINPEATLGELFKEELAINYIRTGDVQIGYNRYKNGEGAIDYSEKQFLFAHRGENILNLINKTNEKSVNLFAEQLLALSALKIQGAAQNLEENAAWMEKFWKQRLSPFNARLTDGSGLSRTNAISASDFCALLEYMHQSKHGVDFLNSLPVTGQHGTLKSYNKGTIAEGRVFAKTGTMNGIKSYAGYVKTKSGKTLCFSLIINNSEWSGYEKKVHVQRLFSLLAQL